jgi:CheY-like chemotaxis protein
MTDPRDALELLRQRATPLDLMITDYSMPHINGVDLAQSAASLRPGMPILLLTGFVEELPEEALRQAGITGVLRKPVTIGELAEAVRRALPARR